MQHTHPPAETAAAAASWILACSLDPQAGWQTVSPAAAAAAAAADFALVDGEHLCEAGGVAAAAMAAARNLPLNDRVARAMLGESSTDRGDCCWLGGGCWPCGAW